jgi:hypothetical protein
MASAADIADKLDEARALIERGWCQGDDAKGKSGKPVDVYGRYATCFCAYGAIMRVTSERGRHVIRYPMRTALVEAIGNKSLEGWNDSKSRTQAEVIEAFRKAAELARAEAAK